MVKPFYCLSSPQSWWQFEFEYRTVVEEDWFLLSLNGTERTAGWRQSWLQLPALLLPRDPLWCSGCCCRLRTRERGKRKKGWRGRYTWRWWERRRRTISNLLLGGFYYCARACEPSYVNSTAAAQAAIVKECLEDFLIERDQSGFRVCTQKVVAALLASLQEWERVSSTKRRRSLLFRPRRNNTSTAAATATDAKFSTVQRNSWKGRITPRDRP